MIDGLQVSDWLEESEWGCEGDGLYVNTTSPVLEPSCDAESKMALTSPQDDFSFDPCNYYDIVDDYWRNTIEIYNFYIGHDDTIVEWDGWYRLFLQGNSACQARCIDSNAYILCRYTNWNGWYPLFYQGNNVEMPDSCKMSYVTEGMCGTFIPLWLNGAHPQLVDGVVTRQVCGSWNSDCCYHNSSPIQVKACTGGYYVYKFMMVLVHHLPPQPTTVITTAFNATVEPCEELNCTGDECCGKTDDVYGCFCNHDESRLLPESYDIIEVCEGSSGTISLSICQLFEAGFPGNSLHLNDHSCSGTVQNGRVMFQFDNDDHICGTNLMVQ
ncbi:uromodulin-like [Electrophorus electricus]|uniref:uromodulin-like n=1 Tax=Electrophorus electricus TaxID=8005 RepID=UPI0015D05163|nr:uromodulin-like [Electrophorus electricus]